MTVLSSLPPPPPRPAHATPQDNRIGRLSRKPQPSYPAESRWGLGDFFVALGIYVLANVVLFVVLLLVDGIGFFNGGGDINQQLELLTSFWIVLFVAIPPLLQVAYLTFAVRRKGCGLKRDLKVAFQPRDWGLGLVLAIVGIVVSVTIALLMEILLGISPNAAIVEDIQDSQITIGLTRSLVLFAFFVALVVPVLEEIIYRGLLWGALEKRGMREEAILVITSLVFAAVHLEPARFVILFILGLLLGYGRIRTGRIGASVAAHIYINSVSMIFLLFFVWLGSLLT